LADFNETLKLSGHIFGKKRENKKSDVMEIGPVGGEFFNGDGQT